MKRIYPIIITLLLFPPPPGTPDEPGELERIRTAIAEKGLDWTATDYGRTFALGLVRAEDRTRAARGCFTYSGKDLPAYVDWGPNGLDFVSPVKDQENCGSCWAFAAVGTLESSISISNNTPGSYYDLSEQILISCCAGNFPGCSGGSVAVAAEFLLTDGTYYEDCFPYQADDLPCDQACPEWKTDPFRLRDYQPIEWSLEAMKEAISIHGPIQATMDVYGDFFSYSSGIYEYSTGQYSDGHAIILIGYQDKPGGEYGGGYFICKNSWGPNWGEDGFFRVGYSQVSRDMRFGDNAHIYYFDGPPEPSPTPGPTPPEPPAGPPRCEDDFNGDGTADIALFRADSGLWAIRGVSRFYFGTRDDRPVPGDYTGDRTTDIGLFRPSSGLWVIRNVTRYYFGSASDIPAVADYDGDASSDPGLFRPSSGLWAVKGLSRAYFGSDRDTPIARDYTGDGSADIALFREASGLWAIRGVSRFYFGEDGDRAIRGDYDGDRTTDIGLFRPGCGLWAIRGVSRVYFGGSRDQAIPADYNGVGQAMIAVFRESAGLWAFEDGARFYFGKTGDRPVSEGR